MVEKKAWTWRAHGALEMGMRIGQTPALVEARFDAAARGPRREGDVTPRLNQREEQDRRTEAGFGANTVGPASAALQAIDANFRATSRNTPTVEERREEARDRRIEEARQAEEERQARASEARREQAAPPPEETTRPAPAPQADRFNGGGTVEQEPRTGRLDLMA